MALMGLAIVVPPWVIVPLSATLILGWRLDKGEDSGVVGTVTLDCSLGSAVVVDGDLSVITARIALTTGLCGELTQEMVNLTGRRPVFVFPFVIEQFESDPEFIFEARHVALEGSSGGIVDATGPKSLVEVGEFYGDVTVVVGTVEMLDYRCGESGHLANFARSALELEASGSG